MENTEETMRVVMAAVMMVAEYVLVLAAVLADLWSGLRKARRQGEARRSEALRRTVSKLGQYYNAMFALTVVDLMQMGVMFYLRLSCGWDVLLLPVLTVIGAIGIAVIEVKSIFEKAEQKQQNDYREAAALLLKLVRKLNDQGVIKVNEIIGKIEKNTL